MHPTALCSGSPQLHEQCWPEAACTSRHTAPAVRSASSRWVSDLAKPAGPCQHMSECAGCCIGNACPLRLPASSQDKSLQKSQAQCTLTPKGPLHYLWQVVGAADVDTFRQGTARAAEPWQLWNERAHQVWDLNTPQRRPVHSYCTRPESNLALHILMLLSLQVHHP